jgi:phosphate:Na+ symporter
MWVAAGTFLGGLGLFLLAMSMITEGLKLAAGQALRAILSRFTQTPARGVASGALMTGIVQSSSAVTIATIGFVNAGLLTTGQALGVVYGSTIGTTMTGWLVTLAGFRFSITVFALPLVGIGMLVRLLGPTRRSGAIGEVIAGFGLFFVGVDLLRGAFEGAAHAIDIGAFSPDGIRGTLMFAAIGLFMTVLTQSSSAAVAIVLTAAAGGVLPLTAAAAMVIGATIGTTSTSILAVIGATANARRVAAGNVVIHVFSGLVGFALLPVFLWLALPAEPAAGPATVAPALALAAFHTTFSALGVLLFWPIGGGLARMLDARLRTPAEQLGRPWHLDSNVLFSPTLALDAFMLELRRMAGMARSLAVDAAALEHQQEDAAGRAAVRAALQGLVQAVEQHVAALERDRMPAAVGAQLPLVLRISNYIGEIVSLIGERPEDDAHLRALLGTGAGGPAREFLAETRVLIEDADPWQPGFDPQVLAAAYDHLVERWRSLKTRLLQAAVDRDVPLWRLNPAIEGLRARLRLAERCTRMAIRLSEFEQQVTAGGLDAAQPGPPDIENADGLGDPDDPDAAASPRASGAVSERPY